MLTLQWSRPVPPLPPSRRAALRAGCLSVAGLTLSDLFRLQATSHSTAPDKSVILVWLDGGPSHIETFDPKPEAPAEYRGPFRSVATTLPSVRFCELMPRLAQRTDRLAILRSVRHGTGDHFTGAAWMVTGRGGPSGANTAPRYPSIGSYTARILGSKVPGLPPYVGLPAAETIYLFPGYMGATYLGPTANPFDVDREQKYLGATDSRRVGRPKCFDAQATVSVSTLHQRRELLNSLDTLRRDLDRSGTADALDRYQVQALDMVTGDRVRQAFDIDKEDPRRADRYGPGPWGRYCLMARRLVEAGVRFVTVDMPHWDDHSNLEKSHGVKVPVVDQAVSALLDDLTDRGLLDRVAVVVMGEFGRTPKINNGLPGQPIPGRDHWGEVFSVLLAGGGLKMGQVIGRSDPRGETPRERPIAPGDILATLYKLLGIDTEQTFKDHTGRPIPILDTGTPIAELF